MWVGPCPTLIYLWFYWDSWSCAPFTGLGVLGPPCTHSSLPVDLEALPGWILSVGSGLLMTVQLCTCVPPPPPACLPSVCEINVVFVWISAAFVALLHLSQKGKQAYRPQPHASLLPFISTVSALDKAGSWVGWEGCWAEDSVPLNICIDGHDEVGVGRGMGPGVCVGEDGECPSPMPSGL